MRIIEIILGSISLIASGLILVTCVVTSEESWDRKDILMFIIFLCTFFYVFINLFLK